MDAFLGIDLGTSSVKALVIDANEQLLAEAEETLEVSRPQPTWSEQDPESWWTATDAAMRRLAADHGDVMARVTGIGLSGQMHGATLLDAGDNVLRPAILWNDGRCAAECAVLEEREPKSRAITGNMAMPGFTAPKLVWVAQHEPEIFRQVAKVLLPKDYLRLRLTGEYASDMSDAAGTLWLDVAARDWSDAMLAACELDRSHMPRAVEGTDPTGTVRAELASVWGLADNVVVAGGAGDNAASAAGIGTVVPGRAFLSLGTSGVYFVANEAFSPMPDRGLHAFCHCLPGLWHQMAVMLNAASCFGWATAATGAASEAALTQEAAAVAADDAAVPLFLPYLGGERTPHNDPHARGAFFGLTPETGRGALGRAVLEGVAFAFADCEAVIADAHAEIDQVALVGGGARSELWADILAAVLGRPLVTFRHGERGAAFGAARLGRIAATGEDPAAVCTLPPIDREIAPNPALAEAMAPRLEKWRRLYPAVKDLYA